MLTEHEYLIHQKYKTNCLFQMIQLGKRGKYIMFKVKPKCVSCGKDIQGGELVYVELRYPEYAGMTEIKKWLDNEGKINCKECHSKQ